MNWLYRWSFYILVGLVGLVVIYATARFVHIAMGSIYQGDRAPYLQQPSPTAMTIRWQTEVETIGTIKYGLSIASLDHYSEEESETDSHEIRLTDLTPATRYYYAPGTKGKQHTGSPDLWFVTPPDKEISTRFWVLGDPGYPTPKQSAVRNAMLKWTKQNPRLNRPFLDFVLTTGDNAYTSGKHEEYQQGFFSPFQEILRNIPVWPAYGNHDARRWAFFDLFSLPEEGESGGVPSGTENYYSFDYSNIHFVMLDSHTSSRRANGEMANWLRRDLTMNKKTWLIAIFHHPPYTRGSHNSDNINDSRGRMTDMRENILPILEQGGVDLVFSGHSHVYERSYLLDCHYGTSDELQPSMLKNGRSHGPYRKNSTKSAPHQGAVYSVVGSSVRADYGPLNHPVMAISKQITGSMIIDVDGMRLDARFIDHDSKVVDEFTIEKGVTDFPAGTGVCPG